MRFVRVFDGYANCYPNHSEHPDDSPQRSNFKSARRLRYSLLNWAFIAWDIEYWRAEGGKLEGSLGTTAPAFWSIESEAIFASPRRREADDAAAITAPSWQSSARLDMFQ
jgi:hypothetical protein